MTIYAEHLTYLYLMTLAAKPIYLDYHATTPVDARVLEIMLPWFSDHFGNPASRSHAYGWQASEAVELARSQTASLMGAEARSIYFTSGATEGLNMAIKGTAEWLGSSGRHVISVSTEHHAVIDSLKWLASKGYEVTSLHVDAEGRLDLNLLQSSIRNDTVMVVVMWANNETGVIQDMAAIGRICRESGILLICDATQAVGKIMVSPEANGIDILAFSAHKMYGPKGAGALYLNPSNRKARPAPLIHGGGHEGGLRSGTLNVPGIVGLGAAAEIRNSEMSADYLKLKALRDHFESTILASVPNVLVNGHPEYRLPSVSNLRVVGVDSQAVMSRFRTKLAISSGSACSSADPEPSHVLLAMGLTTSEAKGSFRVSFGVPTTSEEVEQAAVIFREAIEAEREISPLWLMFRQGIDIS